MYWKTIDSLCIAVPDAHRISLKHQHACRIRTALRCRSSTGLYRVKELRVRKHARDFTGITSGDNTFPKVMLALYYNNTKNQKKKFK